MSHWSTTTKTCLTCQGSFLPGRWTQRRCGSCLTVCSVDGCSRPVKGNGLCAAHDWRLRARGDAGEALIRAPRGVAISRASRQPSIQCECAKCGKAFTMPHSLAMHSGADARRFCSRACYYATKDTRPTFTCGHCAKETLRSLRTRTGREKSYNYNQKYCSKACRFSAQRKGGHIDKHGYRVLTVDGKALQEHREVMASIIGRPLKAHETVHHKNGDRADNRPANLELWSCRHGKGQRVSDKIDFCKSFLAEYGLQVPVIDPSDYIRGLLAI